MSLIGIATAIALLVLLLQPQTVAPSQQDSETDGQDGRGFRLLLAIGACDTAPRMGYLLFLPFLLQSKGGAGAIVGVSFALLFAGGAFGKACCGWLGQHLGVVWSVVVTEGATALLILATLVLPLEPMLVVLPLLGVVLNGTSSVLYGTVPELARKGEVGRAFAMFYTGVIGAGGLAPIAYGAVADHSSRTVGIVASALTATVIIPLVIVLGRFLRSP